MIIKAKLDMKKAKERLVGVEKRAGNANIVMKVIAVKAYKEVLKNFENEKGKSGKWPKWSRVNPKTKKRIFYSTRPTKRGGSKLLQDTGELKNSLQFKALRNQATVFTKTYYAVFHQYGTVTIPKRDFMWLSKRKINEIRQQFVMFLSRGRV